jgi:hypothetical protein
MTTQYTPGPWVSKWEGEGEKKDWVIITDEAGGIIANVNTKTGPTAWSAPAMRVMPADANSRLIASAPALLEALKAILPVFDNEGTKGYARVYVNEILRAETAIAQAEGQGA